MGLFSKKESVPDLPPAPTLPHVPQAPGKKNLPNLPSFPQSAKNENLNREIVKSAVSDDLSSDDEDMTPSLPEFPRLPQREMMTPMIPSKEPEMIPRAIPEPPRPIVIEEQEITRAVEVGPEIVGEKKRPASSEPIFVRIDKFQASQESFEKILGKVKEIETTIAKLKKVRTQEENELEKWSSEVEQLKARLSDVDDNIFSQV